MAGKVIERDVRDLVEILSPQAYAITRARRTDDEIVPSARWAIFRFHCLA